MLFLGLAVLICCPWMRKPCFFAFCNFCKLAYLMGDCVSLRSDITYFVLVIHAFLTQILKHCFCAIFSCVKNIAQVKAAQGLSSAYESNLVKSYHKFKHKSRSNFRISTRHQLQHLNQTSASLQNLKFKIMTKQSFRMSTKIQLHNLHKTSAAKY